MAEEGNFTGIHGPKVEAAINFVEGWSRGCYLQPTAPGRCVWWPRGDAYFLSTRTLAARKNWGDRLTAVCRIGEVQ